MDSFWTLENLNNLVGIATPFILLFWFYYSQRESLSQKYFTEIDGIYAGFTDPQAKMENYKLNAGMVMNIRDTDDKGFFKGEFDYAESYLLEVPGGFTHRMAVDGIHTFMGKLDFQIYRNKVRHPFKPEQNRIYFGTLYIVDRLDFSFEDYKIENYLRAEYQIKHHREMQTMEFELKKTHRKIGSKLPEKFILYKKMGASFEPYINVKQAVFNSRTFCDA